MERKFSVEAKSFTFSVRKGDALVRLEEKRKGFGGFILLGSKCSVWLADVVEEVMGAQRKGDFARSFRDEVRTLKVRMGSNQAGCFLEVAVFVEGGRKGVIRLPEGRGGWGWQRFVDELRVMVAHLDGKALPVVLDVIDGEVGCATNAGVAGCSNTGVVVCDSCSKSSAMDAQAHRSVLGSNLWPSPEVTMEMVRCVATDFLAKVRAEVDRVLFFGLGLKVDASCDIKRGLGRALSRLGLKPKLLFGLKWRGRRRHSGVVSHSNKIADGVRVPVSSSGQGEGEEDAASEKAPEVRAVVSGSDKTASPAPSGKARLRGVLRPSLLSPELELEMGVAVPRSSGEISNRSVVEAELTVGIPALESVADGSDEISVLPTSSSTNSASLPSPVSSPTSPVSPSPEPSGPIEAHDLPIPESVMVEEAPNSPENTQSQDSGGGCRGSLCNAPSSKLALTDPVGSSFSPEHSGLVDVSEGSESALVFPEAQLMVNGLTETQAWYIGWLRDSTQNHNLLAFIDCMEEHTRRKNEVVPPPLVCSTELSKLKAMFKAEIRDENRETVVQNLALAAAAEAGFTVGPRG
jgi:hypothetical protein